MYPLTSLHSLCGDTMQPTNKYLEKIAVDVGPIAEWLAAHGAIGGGVHVSQNLAMDKILKKSTKYHKLFSDYFHAGLQGSGFPGKAHVPKRMSAFGNESEFVPHELGGEAQHLAHTAADTGYVKPTGSWSHRILGATNPELQILLEEAHHAGHKARGELLKKPTAAVASTKQYGTGLLDVRTGDATQRQLGIDRAVERASTRSRVHRFADDMEDRGVSTLESAASKPTDIYEHMGRRSAAIYARALRGDFTHLHDMVQRYPGLKAQIHHHLSVVERRTTHPVTHILQSRQRAQDIEAAYKQNPVTGNLFSSLANKPRDMSAAGDNLTRRGTSMYQGAAAMAALDPVAGILNASKLVLSDAPQILDKVPTMKRVAENLSKKFVTEPVAEAGRVGYEEGKRHKWYYRLYKKNLMNNAVGQVEDANNAIGHAAGKYTQGIRKALAVGEDVQ